AVSRWHDIAGYTIIALVFVGTMGLAHLLGSRKTVAAGVSPANTNDAQRARLPQQIPAALLTAALCWLLFVEIGSAAWYRIHERNLIMSIAWSVKWPQQAPNFRTLKIDEEVRSVLRFDEGHAAAWTITSTPTAESAALTGDLRVPEPKNSPMRLKVPQQDSISCLLYTFRWKPGRNSALLANLHRPDVCLPASGWTQVADDGVQDYPVAGEFQLPFRHFEFQRTFEDFAPQTAHAFYCLSEDRAAAASDSSAGESVPSMSGTPSKWTRAERLRSVMEGRRHLGQQVIEAIFISSKPF